MFRQLLQRLLNSTAPQLHSEENHIEKPKNPIQRNPVESIIKKSQNFIAFTKEETSCVRKKDDTLASYLARCSLAYILDRDKETLPKLLEGEVNHPSCDQLNLLDQQFRRHFNWRTLEILNKQLIEGLKSNTVSPFIKTVSLMWPNSYIREASLQHIDSSSDPLSI